ncbi:MAG TPA: carboxymuconolactone decarboxylase family protein [Acidimicrobiales bacterium]|nr:carboxymuconolactone decarboxylase family protein [Acidimicrobiales bacterium]
MATRPGPPRILPLPEEGRDTRVSEMLDPIKVDGVDLNIFATLVRHPGLFKRWASFGGYLLYRGELAARHRELLILRTAWNTRAEYEWGQHARIARSVGLDDAEITRVIDGPGAPGWTSLETALLTAADELHRDASISDETWGALAQHYDEHRLIEVCMVVGQYHLVAFTLNSLGVEREPGVTGFP